MSNFFISYDLKAPDKNYAKVIAQIKALDKWAHVLLSVFYVSSRLTLEQVRDHVLAAMDADDKLLVIEASRAGWMNLPTAVREYMLSNWNTP